MPGKYAGFIMSDSYKKKFLTQTLDEFKSGDKSKAFEKLENYLKNNPNDSVSRFNFAIMCNETGTVDLAINNYKQVIENDKSHWESRFNLYIIYLDKQLYKQAYKYVNEVLELKKNFQPAQRDKALILNYLQKRNRSFPIGLSKLPGAGYILTGGVSPLSRAYGLAIDNIESIKGFLGNGTFISLKKNQINPEEQLIWEAIKGAAPFFSIITEIELKTIQSNPIKVIEGFVNLDELLVEKGCERSIQKQRY